MPKSPPHRPQLIKQIPIIDGKFQYVFVVDKGNLPESVREPNYAMEDFVRRMIKSLGVESVICKELFTVLSEKKYDYFYDGNCDLEDFINRSK